MGVGSLWHWVIVLLIVLILFGRGRIAEMMGDFGKGISSFKKGMKEAEDTVAAARIEPPAPVAAPPAPAAPAAAAPATAEKNDTASA